MAEQAHKHDAAIPLADPGPEVLPGPIGGLPPGLLQRKLARRVAQRHAAAQGTAPAAAAPATGGGQPLPDALRARMEGSFRSDFSAVRVHEGGEAPALGAAAFTQGTDIHFAPGRYDPGSQSGQALLGHELAHVVQQSQGRVSATAQAKGVDINDDPALEREADEQGERAARGEAAGTSGGAAGAAGPVQRYAETSMGGMPWRVADDLAMAVRQDSPVYGGRFFYADSGLIKSAGDTLKAQGSRLTLKAGGDSKEVVSADGATKKTLTRVEPVNNQDKTAGNDRAGGMRWPEDCGDAANSVMQGDQRNARGVFRSAPSGFFEKIWAWLSGQSTLERETEATNYGTVYETYRGRRFFSPHKMMTDIFTSVLDKDPDKAWQKYQALSPADREKFDQQVGLNKYAQAEVGEAYSIVANKDEQIDQGTWNFHWGAVVMRSGGDSVTLENFANSGQDAWDFQMYGPPSKAGQTFHEQQKNRTKADGTPEYGDNPTTIRVRME